MLRVRVRVIGRVRETKRSRNAACAKALHEGAPLSWPPSATDCSVVESSSSRPHHRSRQQE